jgi:hypothetical protein
MNQIILIPINSNSVSGTEIKNQPPRPIPTFDSFVSMIDSFIHLPTPLPYSEPEAELGPVTYFGNCDHLEGNDHVSDTVDQSFGLGLGLGLGFEGDRALYDYNDNALLPFSGYNYIPINTNPITHFDTNTNTQFDTSSPIYSFSHTDTPLHQFSTYSPINQFAHTEYTLPPPPPFSTSFDQHPLLPEVIDPFPFPLDTQPPQPEHLAVSPTGHWTPITPTSQLPSQDLAYLYEPFPPPQAVQIPYIQDHTPTLAPHYPDYELDLEMTNDPFQPHYSWDQMYVTPSSVADE